MLPLPPVIAWTLAAIGAVAVSKVLTREWRRVNAELDEMRAKASVEPQDRNAMPKLKPDPKTGEYRPS